MAKKRKLKNYVIGALILLVLVVIFFFQTKQQIFEFGFEPYGESVNQITDLILISKTVASAGIAQSTLQYDSKYWDITQNAVSPCDLKDYGCSAIETQLFSGSDLELISATPQGGGADRANPITTTIYESKEDFSERDFKTNIISRPAGASGTTYTSYGHTSVQISLVGSSGEVNVINHLFSAVSNPADLNVVISPSVISNKINIYENGIKTKQITYSGNYKIKVEMQTGCGSLAQGKGACGTTIRIQPSYKQQFGCTTKPSEQTYVIFFNEGSIVSMDKLDRFTKFCLSESPLKIYSNTGGTTNTEILEGLVANEKYTVPLGQIWSIEYIGEKGIFATECEANQLYNLNEGECLARAVVNLQCAEGSTFDFDKGYCIMETEPILYTLSTIETHKSLEQGGQFRFTHIKSDKQEVTPNSIQIGESTFNSNGVSYDGFESGIAYPQDKSNWKTSFTFNGLHEGDLGDKFNLNEFYNVEITRIEGYRSKTMNVDDYTAEYTFEIKPDFLTTSYSDKIIIVTNNFESFDGGITITKTDNLGNTIVEKIEKKLIVGENKFNIDTTNLIKIKVRPFIKISTPEYSYSFDAVKAMTVDLTIDDIDDIIDDGTKLWNPMIILFIIAGVLFVVVAILVIRRIIR